MTASSDSHTLTCQTSRSLSDFARMSHRPTRSHLVSWRHASGPAFFPSASARVGLISHHMSFTTPQSARARWGLDSSQSAYSLLIDSNPDSRSAAVLSTIGSCALQRTSLYVTMATSSCPTPAQSYSSNGGGTGKGTSSGPSLPDTWHCLTPRMRYSAPFLFSPSLTNYTLSHFILFLQGPDRDPPTISSSGQPIQYHPPSATPILGADAPTISVLMKGRQAVAKRAASKAKDPNPKKRRTVAASIPAPSAPAFTAADLTKEPTEVLDPTIQDTVIVLASSIQLVSILTLVNNFNLSLYIYCCCNAATPIGLSPTYS